MAELSGLTSGTPYNVDYSFLDQSPFLQHSHGNEKSGLLSYSFLTSCRVSALLRIPEPRIFVQREGWFAENQR